MSTIKWTYKDNIRGIALKDGSSFKKGDSIPVQVYDLYMDSRGGNSSTRTVYYFGNEPTMEDKQNVMQMPKTAKLKIGDDFEIAQETSTGVSSLGDIKPISNNKTIMWLAVVVVGYFAYKKFKK
tara:strand:+ start:591 stop:962 length:372 start_codon:yes stop_codon:yes gene_type:complete